MRSMCLRRARFDVGESLMKNVPFFIYPTCNYRRPKWSLHAGSTILFLRKNGPGLFLFCHWLVVLSCVCVYTVLGCPWSIFILGKQRPRDTYCSEISDGPQLLRPYHLAWRSDFGLSGVLEPEELYTLAELVLAEGQLG